jgi:hypothetical protein
MQQRFQSTPINLMHKTNIYIYIQVHFKRKNERFRMLRGLPLLKLAGSQRCSEAIQGPARLLRIAALEDSSL